MDHEAPNRILDRAVSVGPRCGSVILIGIDGRSGGGKTRLSGQVVELAERHGLRTAVVHNDVLCPGWDGLFEVPVRLRTLVEHLAANGRTLYPTWDWVAGGPGADAEIPESDLVIIEGVAAIDPAWVDQRSLSVWVEAPAPERKVRAIDRDGASFAAHWDAWAAAEDQYYAANPPRPDLIVQTTDPG